MPGGHGPSSFRLLLLSVLQTQWENTADNEKPAAVGIIIGVVVAQIAIGATVDAVDKVPIFRETLQFIGLAVSAVFAYKNFSDVSER